jgi:hypothetical protein
VVSQVSFKIAFIVAAFNNLEVLAVDMGYIGIVNPNVDCHQKI